MPQRQQLFEPATIPLTLTSGQVALDVGPDTFGWLENSEELVGEDSMMRERLQASGYLFLPGFLDRSEVQAVRQLIIERLRGAGQLDPDIGDDAVPAGPQLKVPDLAAGNQPLQRLLYGEAMMQLAERLFDCPVRHFDFTWMRAVARGHATRPHADLVFMGRGTDRMLTAWVPLGDIPLERGGLMILEGSHRSPKVLAYAARDVDTYCRNEPGEEAYAREVGWRWDGSISEDVRALRQELGGRWLTAAQYRMGDLLIFLPFLVHASLTNQTDQLRFSSDSRYQPAHLPADERWIGERPIGHGPAAKRGVIC